MAKTQLTVWVDEFTLEWIENEVRRTSQKRSQVVAQALAEVAALDSAQQLQQIVQRLERIEAYLVQVAS